MGWIIYITILILNLYLVRVFNSKADGYSKIPLSVAILTGIANIFGTIIILIGLIFLLDYSTSTFVLKLKQILNIEE